MSQKIWRANICMNVSLDFIFRGKKPTKKQVLEKLRKKLSGKHVQVYIDKEYPLI